MKPYNPAQKTFARELRNNQTDAEQLLWQRLRRKQIHGQRQSLSWQMASIG